MDMNDIETVFDELDKADVDYKSVKVNVHVAVGDSNIEDIVEVLTEEKQ